jgi:thiol-disulfide isomerase/thioredoxin
MKRTTLTLAAITALAGAPAYAQTDAAQPTAAQPTAKDQPRTAPGIQVERITDLQVADRAPELAISEWLKGEPVTGFEKGRVYVVEFWATWCGPCVASMPHISELQKKYADKGVRIIGVQIWEEPAMARPFVETGKGADRTDYTIAVEEKIEGEDPSRTGQMAKTWMKAAGRNGIPSAFLINQDGYIAWMGHPMNIDEPLEKVVAKEWDLQEAASLHVERARLAKSMDDFQAAAQQGDADKAAALAKSLMEHKSVWQDPGTLNMIAWLFVDPAGSLAGKSNELALKAAERAVELTNHEDGMIMDTLAWAQFYAGTIDKALETEQKAVDLADSDQLKEQLQQSLDLMKKMASKSGGG